MGIVIKAAEFVSGQKVMKKPEVAVAVVAPKDMGIDGYKAKQGEVILIYPDGIDVISMDELVKGYQLENNNEKRGAMPAVPISN